MNSVKQPTAPELCRGDTCFEYWTFTDDDVGLMSSDAGLTY